MQQRVGIQMSTRDYEGFRTDMIEMLKKKIPEYSDFSQSDMGIVLIELLAHNLDVLSYYNDKVANELFLETAQERESVARLCRMLGYTLRESSPSKFKQVFEIIPQQEDYLIPKGYVISTEGSNAEMAVFFETDEDLVIPKDMTGIEKDLDGNYLYSVSITEGSTVTNDIIGSSNGTPNQAMQLNFKPVILDSIELYVNEGVGYEQWTRVDNFLESTSTSKHYLSQLNEDGVATIKFGNGVSGKIPEIRTGNIMCNYRTGGGTIGNVGPMTISNLPQKMGPIQDTFNPSEAYVLGRNKESIDVARVKAPYQLGTKYGLVTKSDYTKMALSIPSVIRSNAELSDINTNLVLVNYISDGTLTKDDLEQTLTELYADRKMVGTKVIIQEGVQRPMHIDIVAKPFRMGVLEVKSTIETTLKSELVLGKYDFKESPEPSDIITLLLGLDGVRSVDVKLRGIDKLKDNEIICLGELNIDVIGGI